MTSRVQTETATRETSIEQLEHTVKVCEIRIQAKKQEIDSYAMLRDEGPVAFEAILRASNPAVEQHTEGGLYTAILNLFAAKVNEGILDLEDLELELFQAKVLLEANRGRLEKVEK